MTAPPSAPRLSLSARRILTTAVWCLLAAAVLGACLAAYLLAVPESSNATRGVLFNIGQGIRWLLYASTAVLFVIIALGPLRRAKLWRLGRPEQRLDPGG